MRVAATHRKRHRSHGFRTFLDVLARGVLQARAVHLLSILLSITAPWRVTSWTRAKRLGAIFSMFSLTAARQ
jgi:hypothetical protein